jgi:hypothetical protein
MAKYISNEEYQANLQKEFSDLTAEDLVNHINKSETFLSELGNDIEEERYEFIKSICNTARQMDELTFKQWKALSAFNRDCTRLKQTVTLKKSLTPSGNKNDLVKKLSSGLMEMDTTHWTPERKAAYEQYLSKQALGKQMEEDVEKFLDDYFKSRDIENRFGNKYEIDIKKGTAKTKKKLNGNNN